MVQYFISKHKKKQHVFCIKMQFKAEADIVWLQLPAWRPGRYELQNFAKNVIRFEAKDNKSTKEPVNYEYNPDRAACLSPATSGASSESGQGASIMAGNNVTKSKKITKDCWEITANKAEITVEMEYYAAVQDAGNSYADEQVSYINFVNCLPHLANGLDRAAVIQIEINENWNYACALQFDQRSKSTLTLTANNYYELYDSPFIASAVFESKSYEYKNYKFHIHFIGNYAANWAKLLPAFEAFTTYQIEQMGDFPEPEYHFIHYILPHAYYHGVEHGRSTMLVLGPDNEGDSLIHDILGVGSHELFHAWNICKIRPAQLLPYNYSRESYFDTGFVVEGVTTYLGDLFLLHSAVIDKATYLTELNAICIRHFTKNEPAGQNLLDASMDLWVDGYTAGSLGKKVSIYNKGALVALILDIILREKSKHNQSIYTLMKAMWERFGKKNIGYTLADYKNLAEEIYGDNLSEYFEICIESNKPLLTYLNKNLAKIGLKLWVYESSCELKNTNTQKWANFAQAFFTNTK